MGTTTQAEQVARRFNDDGQTWRDSDGAHLSDVLHDTFMRGESQRVASMLRDAERYVFADGSALTVCGGGWDVGFPECCCWQGAGHDPYKCETAEVSRA